LFVLANRAGLLRVSALLMIHLACWCAAFRVWQYDDAGEAEAGSAGEQPAEE